MAQKHTILIVAALPVEIQELKRICKSYRVAGVKLKFLCSWVWNYKTLLSLQEYIISQKPDFILNIGICGIANATVDTDIFQVARIKNLSNMRELIPPVYVDLYPLRSISCSETIVTDASQMEHELYVDMESYSIDMVSKKYSIAHTLIKIPFDIVGTESKNVSKADIVDYIGKYDYSEILKKIQIWCEKNIRELPDWQYYKKYFWLSVTETENFKKCYYKIRAFDYDFYDFFSKNKHLSKKEFFQKVEKIS